MQKIYSYNKELFSKFTIEYNPFIENKVGGSYDVVIDSIPFEMKTRNPKGTADMKNYFQQFNGRQSDNYIANLTEIDADIEKVKENLEFIKKKYKLKKVLIVTRNQIVVVP